MSYIWLRGRWRIVCAVDDELDDPIVSLSLRVRRKEEIDYTKVIRTLRSPPRWIFNGYDEDLADNTVGRISEVTGQTRMQTATLQAEVPTQLVTQMDVLIEQGWFRSKDELIIDALRRLIETHRPELMEEHLRQDVEWGLHGQE